MELIQQIRNCEAKILGDIKHANLLVEIKQVRGSTVYCFDVVYCTCTQIVQLNSGNMSLKVAAMHSLRYLLY